MIAVLLALPALACNFLMPLPASRLPASVPPAAPSVIGYAPDSGDVLLPGGALDIYYDQAMEQASAEAAFSLIPGAAGRFAVLPALAQESGAPEIYGRGEGSRFTVPQPKGFALTKCARIL